jgi:hypothetical protein
LPHSIQNPPRPKPGRQQASAPATQGDPHRAQLPVAALATTPGLKIIPGCVIASKRKVRSILLVHRASKQLSEIKTVAADTSSRSSLAYTQILFQRRWNAEAIFLPHRPDLDPMLEAADAAMLIGDPALFALEERQNREERTGESLIYHDVAEEWIALTGLPWVAAVWAIREESLEISHRTLEEIAKDFTASRDRGLANLNLPPQQRSAPTVNPAPAAASSTRSPFFSLPSSTAVPIASGIVPAEVLPYFSILIITRSGSIPSRSAVAVIIRLFAWCGIKHPRSLPVTPFRSSTFVVASAILRTANLYTVCPSW